jgi:hypothetical protein
MTTKKVIAYIEDYNDNDESKYPISLRRCKFNETNATEEIHLKFTNLFHGLVDERLISD